MCARPWTVLLAAGLPLAAPRRAGGAPRPPHPERRLAAALDRVGPRDRGPARDGAGGARAGAARRPRAARRRRPRSSGRAGRRSGGSAERLLADPRVARVQGLPAVAGERADDLAYVALLPVHREADLPGLGGGARSARGRPARGRPARRRRRSRARAAAPGPGHPHRARGGPAPGGRPARLQRRLRGRGRGADAPRGRPGRGDDPRRPLPVLPLAARPAQGRRPQPAVGLRRVRGPRPRLPGRPRRAAPRPRRPAGRRLPDRPRSRLLHRLRAEHGLRGLPRRPRGRGAPRRPLRGRGPRARASPAPAPSSPAPPRS